MTLRIDRAAMARALTRALSRAPETKRAPLALGDLDEAGAFEGYASLFGVADLGGDVVARGAFAASLRRRGPAQVKMLWQHDPAEPVGAWLAIEEDARGLKVKGRLNLAVARAREIRALMRDGQVDGLSIGFRTRKATQDRKTGLRHLVEIDLWEISLVTFPMLPQARVTAVKRVRRPDETARIGPGFDSVAVKFTPGDLVADFRTGSGRQCVYKFDFATIVIPGADNFPCWDRILSSAATHGRFLNDN